MIKQLTVPGDQVAAFDTAVLLSLLGTSGHICVIPLLVGGGLLRARGWGLFLACSATATSGGDAVSLRLIEIKTIIISSRSRS